MKVAAIWAQDVNGVLGDGRGMCWSVPEDFKHFKRSTLGSPIIMGRASFEALGRVLPGRENIVITRSADFVVPDGYVVHSLEQSLVLAEEFAGKNGVDVVWVTGGAQIYSQALEYCDELVVTYLDIEVDLDSSSLVYAPVLSDEDWEIDLERSDDSWRDPSGDAKRWKVVYYVRRK